MTVTDHPSNEALVVDDSSAMRTILSRILRGLGFEVHQAGNGLEALEQLGEFARIGFVLVDWNMPEMDGVQFVRSVRASDRHAGLKLVMVSSESDLDRMQQALDAGADEYAMKPFDAGIIREKLELLGLIAS